MGVAATKTRRYTQFWSRKARKEKIASKPAGAKIFSRVMARRGANDKYRSVQTGEEKGLVYETISCATV